MKPILRLRSFERASSDSPRTSSPSSRYSPAVKVSSRPAMLRKVVLPEPEGPVTATYSPSRTCRASALRAWVSTSSVRETLLTWRISSMGLSSSLAAVDAPGPGIAERVAAGDHDTVPFLQSLHDLHRAQAAGAGADGAPHRDVAVHDVGAGAAALFQERAAVHHQHVAPGVA